MLVREDFLAVKVVVVENKPIAKAAVAKAAIVKAAMGNAAMAQFRVAHIPEPDATILYVTLLYGFFCREY